MRFAMVVAAGMTLAACTTKPQGQGREIYMSYCATCHGAGGQGDGVLARDLPVAPADLTALSRDNGGVFPYSRVMAQVYGYPGRFHVMPEFGTLLQGRSVVWADETGQQVKTPEPLLQLTEYLVSIQQN